MTNLTMADQRWCPQAKPPTVLGTCHLPPCGHSTDSSSRASQSSGEENQNAQLDRVFSDQVPPQPEFFTGEWSACTVTCGNGTRSREVTCKGWNVFSKQEEVLPDRDCVGSKPDSLQVCDAGLCYLPLTVNTVEEQRKIFRWHVSEYSSCSRSCLGGTQESVVKCVEEGQEGVVEVSPAHCAWQRKPQVMFRSCNAIPCPPRWDIGDYSACSQQCGGGVMRRSVRCVQQEADDTLRPVEDYRCADPVPVKEMSCNTDYCPAEWTSGHWDECSQTCGIGTQTRRVSCVTEPVAGHRVTVSHALCTGPPPHTSRSCSVRDCPEYVTAPPVIKAENYTFIQLRRSKKVKLLVGGKVVLLPGQSITIRCPVKNFYRRLIFWSRRFKLVPMSGRVRATMSGNLRIRKGNPVSDTGTYTCMAGPESADVRIEFLTRRQAMSRIRDIRQYLRPDQSGPNSTSKFLYVADDWSPCSVTCGSGHQKRQITCTRVTRKYVKMLPERECEKLGLEKPEHTKMCSQGECPQWVAGNWSTCSLTTCVRDGYAQRRRKLYCTYANGTSVPSKLCRQARRPETVRLCVNIDCISHWITSRWTPCHPSCGQQGNKMRILTCSWRKTGRPAWSACRAHPRPNVRKVCKLRPCPQSVPADCDDASRYCSLARMLRMCRYDEFRRNCCRSCRDLLQSTLS
ncbi:protein madd-4-like isoform X2 [Babylonia areolata]